jgi:hypothetical protein
MKRQTPGVVDDKTPRKLRIKELRIPGNLFLQGL